MRFTIARFTFSSITYRWLNAAIVPLIVLFIYKYLFPAVFVDDAYISFKVAQNLATGYGMVFNLGENTFVSTSPLWVLLLAGLRLITGDVIIAARILGGLFEALLLLSLVYLCRRLRFPTLTGILTAILLVVNPVFFLTSLSGMELPLYMFFITLLAISLVNGKHTLALTIGACLLWIRFDGLVFLGTAAVIIFWRERVHVRQQPLYVLRLTLPAVLTLLAYCIFTTSMFETIIPMSVQQKALSSSRLFSDEWFDGVRITLREFLRVGTGRSSYWYKIVTPLQSMTFAFFLGLFLFFKKAQRKVLVPLCLISLAYILSFVSTGSHITHNFPWYFAPVLPALCLITAAGFVWLVNLIQRYMPFKRLPVRAMLTMGVVVFLTIESIDTMNANIKHLQGIQKEREAVYATLSIWAEKQFKEEFLVATNEIGGFGFFLPPRASLLDMIGLLRRKETLHSSHIELIGKQRPHCIFARDFFGYKNGIQKNFPKQYHWFKYRTLEVAVRADLIDTIKFNPEELNAIYSNVALNKELAHVNRSKYLVTEKEHLNCLNS